LPTSPRTAAVSPKFWQNLLDNAMQYTPAGGQIKVSASADGAEVTFTVSDTGIGIPRADQSRIFERFYRV